MDFAPFLEMPATIQLHAASASLAIILGPFAVLRQRRDRMHKIIGYVWVLAMLVVAVSALFIPSFGVAIIGPFGPIHLFVVITLVSLWQGMRAVLQGDIPRHRAWMSGLYWQGLLVAGLVNFLPGRMVNRATFPEHPALGYAVIVLGAATLIWFRILRPRLRPVATLHDTV